MGLFIFNNHQQDIKNIARLAKTTFKKWDRRQ